MNLISTTNLATIYSLLILLCGSSNCPGQDARQKKYDGDDLLAAAQAQDLDLIRTILDAGVDVNSQTKYGQTALYYAADRGNEELARLLLQAGADPNAKDRFYNGTPMSFAQMRKHYSIIQCLVEFGADNPEAILFSAIGSANLELAKAVLQAQKVDKQSLALAKSMALKKDKDEWTALFADIQVPELKPYQPSVEEMESYVGKYVANGFDVTVKLEDEKLKLGFRSAPGNTLKPMSKAKFLMGQSLVVFSDELPAQSVSMSMAGNTFTLSRAPVTTKAEGGAKPKTPEPNSAESTKIEFAENSAAALSADRAISSKNWPMFRGNGSRGIAEGQRPPVSWNVKDNVNVAWKTSTEGLGLSCPTIWKDRIFLTSAVSDNDSGDFRTGLYGDVDSVEDDSEYDFNLYCYNKTDGSLIWKKTAGHAKPAVKRHAKSSHANSTVATDGTNVVAFFASEGLFCYDFDGNLKWQLDLGFLDSGWFYDAKYQWGFASSPVIFDRHVIVQCDIQGQSFIAAFALADGKEIWRTDRDEIPSWSSPVVHQFDDLPMLITYGTNAARGYDARDGQLLWELKGEHSEIVVPTPFVAHDLIFVCSGYSPIRPIFAIKSTARGDITLADDADSSEHIAWMKPRGGPYLPTPVVYGDYLYTCGNAGILTCYEAKTGRLVYKKRMSAPGGSLSFSASVLAADGHLYCSAEDGRVLVIKAGPTYELVSTNPTGENVLATPAISDGHFFIRSQNSLIKIDNQN